MLVISDSGGKYAVTHHSLMVAALDRYTTAAQFAEDLERQFPGDRVQIVLHGFVVYDSLTGTRRAV